MNAADSNPPPPKVSAEEGRRFLDKGLESVKAQEWSLAAGYFAKARESDPWSAAAIFNLGLVNAKAGHELPAMAWLHAYLAASPAASNVPAVREEIERLKSQLRAKVKRMLETSSDGAIKLQDQNQKNDALNLLYLAKAIAGDIQGAVATRRLDSYYKDRSEAELQSGVWFFHAKGLARAGDETAVRDALAHTDSKDDAWRELSGALLSEGELLAARKAARQIENREIKSSALAEIDEALVFEGDLVPAETDLPNLDQNARSKVQGALSLKLAEMGKVAAAAVLAREISATNIEFILQLKARALATVAIEHLRLGDSANAKATAREILTLGSKINTPYDAHSSVVAAAILGNYQGANAVIGQLDNRGFFPFIRDEHLARLAFVQVMSGDLNSAEETARRARQPIGSQKSAGAPEWWIADALIAKGQIERAMEYLPKTRLNLPASLLARVAGAYMKTGKMDKAESAFDLMPLSSTDPDWGPPPKVWLLRFKLASLIEMVEAYQRKGSPKDATRILATAIHNCQDRALLSDSAIAKHYERIARLEEELGDTAGAHATTEFLPSSAVRNWVRLAEDIGRFQRYADTEEALRSEAKDKTTKDLVNLISEVAYKLAEQLYRIEAYEKRFPR